ncbi:MAG: hypothetical protein Q8O29_04740 [Polaromonas sp.]|uniref:hypothetical protein n=1 Tax=Polaromonas sp. TaxID=1869339 RepID=UPI002733CCCB|nr:hypothetical protein [Polaromonas sp.]MDP2817578.1 hypothetical protein [Polaromonas sp.]
MKTSSPAVLFATKPGLAPAGDLLFFGETKKSELPPGNPGQQAQASHLLQIKHQAPRYSARTDDQ